MPHFVQSSTMPCDHAALAAWHMRAGALERLVPPWSGVRAVGPSEPMREGLVVELRVPKGPFRFRWIARHEEVRPGASFVDVMERGPFAAWRHEHRFLQRERPAHEPSLLQDSIAYELPFGVLGQLWRGLLEADLRRTFAWRHQRTRLDLLRHAELGGPPLTVAVSGASGLVGSALVAFLSTGGHSVRRLVRRGTGRPDEIHWDPAAGTVDRAALEGLDAVVHLAGEPIAAGRWSARRKERIRESRVVGTRTLATALAGLRKPPAVLVSASAIGYYGDRTDPVDESSPSGDGFLAEVCRAWEDAAEPARQAGIRTVHPRIGVVLSAAGGVLGTLLTPFSLGLGGPVGSGRQGMSWIALDDLLALVLFALRSPNLQGPINATAPNPVDNRTFGRTLGRVLRRPAFVPLPGFAVRAALGEMGRALLLGGAFVRPERALRGGFRFDFPELEPALRFALGRPAPVPEETRA